MRSRREGVYLMASTRERAQGKTSVQYGQKKREIYRLTQHHSTNIRVPSPVGKPCEDPPLSIDHGFIFPMD